MTPEVREAIAEIEHLQWMAWSRNIATSEAISPERLSRWSAMWVPYAELTEEQKDMDRVWADKVIAVLKAEWADKVIETLRQHAEDTDG